MPPGALAIFRPPAAATDSYRPIVRFFLFCVVPKCPTSWCRSVRTLRDRDRSVHFGINFVVPKCLGAEVSCGRSVRLPYFFYLHNPSLMDYYSFNQPRRDGWPCWSCWLTDSGRFNHKVVTRLAVSLAQDRESSPATNFTTTTTIIITRNRRKITNTCYRILRRREKILRTDQGPFRGS